MPHHLNAVQIYNINIIIICGTDLLDPYPSLQDSARLHPVFTSLNYPAVLLLQNKVVIDRLCDQVVRDTGSGLVSRHC
jgi:hypothetical protein